MKNKTCLIGAIFSFLTAIWVSPGLVEFFNDHFTPLLSIPLGIFCAIFFGYIVFALIFSTYYIIQRIVEWAKNKK